MSSDQIEPAVFKGAGLAPASHASNEVVSDWMKGMPSQTDTAKYGIVQAGGVIEFGVGVGGPVATYGVVPGRPMCEVPVLKSYPYPHYVERYVPCPQPVYRRPEIIIEPRRRY